MSASSWPESHLNVSFFFLRFFYLKIHSLLRISMLAMALCFQVTFQILTSLSEKGIDWKLEWFTESKWRTMRNWRHSGHHRSTGHGMNRNHWPPCSVVCPGEGPTACLGSRTRIFAGGGQGTLTDSPEAMAWEGGMAEKADRKGGCSVGKMTDSHDAKPLFPDPGARDAL